MLNGEWSVPARMGPRMPESKMSPPSRKLAERVERRVAARCPFRRRASKPGRTPPGGWRRDARAARSAEPGGEALQPAIG